MMKHKTLNQIVCLLLCLGVLMCGWTQPPSIVAQKESDNYWRHYSTSNSELLSNTIQAIAYTEDSSTDFDTPGLWIGTDAGVSYTNGYDWIAYTVTNSELPSNNVRAIVKGQKTGELWIATDAGVARLNYAATPINRQDDTWNVFTTAAGLPSNDVLSFVLGKNNEVWAGTTAGLAYYDGITWHAYVDGLPALEVRDLVYDTKQDTLWTATSNGLGMLNLTSETWSAFYAEASNQSAFRLPSNNVHALALSTDGRVWIGTAGGLAVLNPDGTWNTWGYGKAGLPNYPITDLSLDPTGRYLWVSTDGGGASRFSIIEDRWYRVNTLSSELLDNNVHVVLASHVDTIWLGTLTGLSGMEYSGPSLSPNFVKPRISNQLATYTVQVGWVDPDTNTLWVGTKDSGISRSDDRGKSWQTFTKVHGLGSDNVKTIWGDGKDTIWVGTLGGGISRSDDGGASWQTFTTSNGLSSNDVTALWGDNVGTIWVTTNGNGINRCSPMNIPSSCEIFTEKDGLADDIVLTIWGDGSGTMWAGTANGLSRSSDGHSWYTITVSPTLKTNHISAIWGDGANSIWVGTWGGGVSYSSDGGRTWRIFTADNLGSDYIQAIWGNESGTVWVATKNGGISRSDDDGMQWETFRVAEGLSSNNILSIWEDAQGTTWISAEDGGLGYYADNEMGWQFVNTNRTLGSNFIKTIWSNVTSVWVGTSKGVSYTTNQGKDWRTFTTAHGLGDNQITAIWSDGDEVVCIGTQNGGVSYSPDNGISWRTFTTTHGLASNNVTAIWVDINETIWVGTSSNGISASYDYGEHWQTYTKANGLEDEKITAIWGDNDGTIWVSTQDGGISYGVAGERDGQAFTNVDKLGSIHITSLWGNNAGTIWATTRFDVIRITDNGANWEKLDTDKELGANEITGLWANSDGTVWVYTDEGVVVQSSDGGESWHRVAHPAVKEITSIHGNQAGTIWTGTWGDGINYSVDGGTTWETFKTAPLLVPLTVQGSSGEGQLTAFGLRPGVRWVELEDWSENLLNVSNIAPKFTGFHLIADSKQINYTITLSSTVIKRENGFIESIEGGNVETSNTMTSSLGNKWSLGLLTSLPEGTYELSLTATDAFGHTSVIKRDLYIQRNFRFHIIMFVSFVGMGIVMVGGVRYARAYLKYNKWRDAIQEDPLQKIIPLVIPVLKRHVSGEVLHVKLQTQAIQAFCTKEQVDGALEYLGREGVLQKNKNNYYCFIYWDKALLYRLLNALTIKREVAKLAEQIRVQQPLYEPVQNFFTQARYEIRHLDVRSKLLIPQGSNHPLLHYGSIYMRVIAERAPTADDFEEILASQKEYIIDIASTHRVALVISQQRPDPSARFRMYEIRQRQEGLPIIPIDSSLFNQIGSSDTAIRILENEISQATGQQNLYAISAPVSDDLSFFGRERVLQEIVNLLNAGHPVGLFGLRKVGKTSLVQRLQGQLVQKRPVAFVDTQATSLQEGIQVFYPRIINSFIESIKHIYPKLAFPDLKLRLEADFASLSNEDFLHDLRKLHNALDKPREGKRMLLIIDEVDRLLPTDEMPDYEGFRTFFGQLRVANLDKLLDFLVVGVNPALNRTERWAGHDNVLYRALHEVWMPPMEPDNVWEMIESLGSQMGVKYETEALQLLTSVGGGQPFVTRQICSWAVEGRLGRAAVTITENQARVAVESFFVSDAYFSELCNERLNDMQRDILRVLAEAPRAVPRTQLLPSAQRQAPMAALKALEQYTLIRYDKSGYVIAWPVFRDWIRWMELGLED